jgi:hypothetical protein
MKQIELIPGMDFDQVLQQVKDEDVVLTRNGHAIALLSDFDDDELYWHQREQDPEFIASLKLAESRLPTDRSSA